MSATPSFAAPALALPRLRGREAAGLVRAHKAASLFITHILLTLLTGLLALMTASRAEAHDVPPAAIVLDIGFDGIDAELQLPISDLALATSLPLLTNPAAATATYSQQIQNYVLQHVQAQTRAGHAYVFVVRSLHYRRINNGDWIVVDAHFQAPANEPITSLVLDYDVIIKPVVNHNALLSIRRDFRHGLVGDDSKPIGLLGFNETHLSIDLSGGSWWRGFSSVFSLGMKHIAEGTDHMLFLLVLLLPAPLAVALGRWRRAQTLRASVMKIIKTVSGFTVGHSITLILGALGLVQIPSKPIEVLIAMSILVSAWHAMRPVFANKEPYLAAGFGLIHGLAFASSLTGLGYDPTVLTISVLGFNLGIEVMQLAIVAAVLPWLVVLSRTSLYAAVRLGLAGFAALAALGWIGERALNLANPMAPIVDAVAAHALLFVAGLAVFSVSIYFISGSKHAVANAKFLCRSDFSPTP